MAQKVLVELIDDLDGGKAAETVTFGLDGRSYDIDLSGKNAKALRKALEPFVDSARRAGNGKQTGNGARKAAARGRSTTQDVREWARLAGIEVAERGRISADVVAQFEAAQHA